MIGKIMIGKSFGGCINYCLHDKIAEKNKQQEVMKERAEVILYNQCFGNDKELTRQFNEVRQLNPKLSKPVLHVTLSLSQGENLPAYQLAEIAQACARDLGFSNNQYIAVLHKDTAHPHIHIVANRIGFDGRTVSDSKNYQKIAQLCRKMELKFELKQVLSPKRFLAKELRNLPRLDKRKEKLQEHIRESLAGAKNYQDFEQKMKALKYEVIRMRGIAFRDGQKVYTKGSEVGYSLATIERILVQKQTLKQDLKKQTEPSQGDYNKQQVTPLRIAPQKQTEKEKERILKNLVSPTPHFNEGINPELMREERSRRKRRRQRPS
jgi:hypothetical protein